MIYALDYDYSTDTYDGYPERIQIQEGTSGTPATLLAYGRTTSERPDLANTVTRYESTGEQDGRTTTLAYNFYDRSTKYKLRLLTKALPAVSSGNNGSGLATVELRHHDKRTGALRWYRNGEGYQDFYAYDDNTGVRDLTVRDANTSSLLQVIDDNWDGTTHDIQMSDDALPFTRTATATALDIDSSAEIDWLGRVRKTTDAGDLVTYYVHKQDEWRVYPAWNTGTLKCDLPVRVVKLNADGRTLEQLSLLTTHTPSTTSNLPNGSESYTNAVIATWTANAYDYAGALKYVDRYHSVPASGYGSQYTNYYRTEGFYDGMGRPAYVARDVSDETTYDREQVTKTVYDYLGRVTEIQQGVSDNTHDLDLSDADTDGVPDALPTLRTITKLYYDDPDTAVGDSDQEHGEGDGELSWVVRYYGTGAGDHNDTRYGYDWRHRRCLTLPPAAPYTLVKYDHLDRVTATGRYSATTNLDPGDDPATTENGNRLALARTHFDEWGRVCKAERYDDPGDAAPADALTANTYYDRRGLAVATDAPNTGPRETLYDGAGRQSETRSVTALESTKYVSGAFDYNDDDENIVELTKYTLDSGGRATRVRRLELNHNATAGLDATNEDNVVGTWVQHWYDSAHRQTATANYGTNEGNGKWKNSSSAPTYGSSPPARSDTVLVTSYTYDTAGRRTTVTDPKAIETATAYDALGRTVSKTEDSGGLSRKTEYGYTGLGMAQIIHDPSADNTSAGGLWTAAGVDTDQFTEYAYTDSVNANRVTEIRYPTGDGTVGSSASDKIVFTYNVDGTGATRTDQNGTVLTWTYDSLRRKTEEELTTQGSYTLGGSTAYVDNTVQAVTWAYTDEGQVEYLTTHTDTTPDTSTYTDANSQIKYQYDAGGSLTKVETDPDSKVSDNTNYDTRDVEYSYATDYTSSGNYKRRQYVEYPDGKKIWYGYTHTDAASTFEDTINDKFNRIGQLAWDDSGSKGDLLAEYSFNGLRRMVRRLHDDDSGWNANDTRLELFGGVSGEYAGYDQFGRIVDQAHEFDSGAAWTAFEQRQYTYDRNGNRTVIENALQADRSLALTYDGLNRLTKAEEGILVSGSVTESNLSRQYDMDLLGDLVSSAGGLKINAATSTVTHAVNATNEITSQANANPAGASAIIDDDFATSLAGIWTQDTGTWSISSGQVNVDTLASGEALLLDDGELDMVHYSVKATFPASSSTNKAGLILGHDGDDDYFAVVLDRSNSRIAVHKVTGGGWGAALNSDGVTINDSTQYRLEVIRKQRRVEAALWSTGGSPSKLASFSYGSSSDLGVGYAGLYSDKTDVKFDDFAAHDLTAREPLTPGFVGMADASISSGELLVQGTTRGGEAIVEDFSDDDYLVQVDVAMNSGEEAHVWFRYRDTNNGYYVDLDSAGWVRLVTAQVGAYNTTASVAYTPGASVAVKIKVSGTSIKCWIDGSLKLDETDSTHAAGGVALTGDQPTFDDLKIGYDNNADDDIDDVGDDLVVDEDFSSTSATFTYDDAGNLVQDGEFTYTYDAWHRLLTAVARTDADVDVATYRYDGQGRRVKKVVTNAGDLDRTELYFYNDWQVIEARDGSENVLRQIVHGTQYIDEVVVQILENGVAWVHQDANWNVLALTDFAGHVLEHSYYTPYGIMTVDQETHFGDYDGDSLITLAEVDTNTDGFLGSGDTCWGSSPSGDCRVLDFDFDDDIDADDKTVFDSLVSAITYRQPGRTYSGIGNTRGHQGLIFDAELGSYQNRHRQYAPQQRRFMQRDPLAFRRRFAPRSHYLGGLNLQSYANNSPASRRDASGLIPPECDLTEGCCDISWPGQVPGPDCSNCWSTCTSPEVQEGLGMDAGGVYCRPDGCKCACINESLLPPGGTFVEEAMRVCAIVHEEIHVPQVHCCLGLCRWGRHGGGKQDSNECAAYTAEIACLEGKKDDSSCDASCDEHIDNEIAIKSYEANEAYSCGFEYE